MQSMKKSGSILLISLIIVGAVTILTQQLVQNVFVGTRFDTAMIAREKAEMLALSGAHLAAAMIVRAHARDPRGGESISPEKQLIKELFPRLNRWQIFDLTQDLDGIDGQMGICITSEEGKINLSMAYDYERQEFKKPYDQLLKNYTLKNVSEKQAKETDLASVLIAFFKKRKRRLDDVSELLTIPQLKSWPLWYQPSKKELSEPKKRTAATSEKLPEKPIALQDLFTIVGTKDKIHPLLMTDAMCRLVGVERPRNEGVEEATLRLKPLTEGYSSAWGGDWSSNWKHLTLLYPQQPKALASLREIFASEFEPKVYSVVSFGVVNGVEQRLCAMIMLSTTTTGTATQGADKTTGRESERGNQELPFKIVRLYWI